MLIYVVIYVIPSSSFFLLKYSSPCSLLFSKLDMLISILCRIRTNLKTIHYYYHMCRVVEEREDEEEEEIGSED